MDKTAFFALAFMYPYPGHSENLLLESKKLLDEPEGKLVQNFAESLNSLSLSEQEELYTRTLDLNPMAAPYVGYQIWGESYKRGEFMAALNHEMIEDNVELDGELPDWNYWTYGTDWNAKSLNFALYSANYIFCLYL